MLFLVSNQSQVDIEALKTVEVFEFFTRVRLWQERTKAEAEALKEQLNS